MDMTQVLLWAGVVGALVAAVVSAVVPPLIKQPGPVRDAAIGGADYVEALKDAVVLAENTGMLRQFTGAEKFALAIKRMENWLEEAGIHGDAKRITLERVKADLELTRAAVFPSKGGGAT